MHLSSLSIAVHVALVAVPVAVYFLVLGMLNSRQRPQLLTARQDFALLVGALAPLLLIPAQQAMGWNPWAWGAAGAGAAALAALLAPRRGRWVIYNMSAQGACRLVVAALEQAGWQVQVQADVLELGADRRVRLSGFALLRNDSVQAEGLDGVQEQALHQALASQLEAAEALPHPMAAAMLLVAAFMLCAPLALVAREAPEIVRLISDLL